MPKKLGVSLILNSLNKDYDPFVRNYNMHSMGKSIVELHAMLKLHEKGAKGKDRGKNKLAYAPKTKILPLPKRDNLEKDLVFHHSKEVGHWRKNYLSYQAELKKKKNVSVASTLGAKGKDRGKNKLAYAPKTKILPLPKRDNLEKDLVFHHSKEVGHWRKNYLSYQAELKKKKNVSVASTLGIFTIELYAFPNKN
nr:hypothetical protein [Tanacetum cinerariifolium]